MQASPLPSLCPCCQSFGPPWIPSSIYLHSLHTNYVHACAYRSNKNIDSTLYKLINNYRMYEGKDLEVVKNQIITIRY